MAVEVGTHLWNRLSHLSSEHLIEGTFWSLWCGNSLKKWSNAVQERREVDLQALSAADRAEQIWKASKNLFVNTCSALSGLSGVICWAAETSLICIGAAFPYISAGGYWASSLVSGTKIWETLGDLGRDLFLYAEVDESQTKGEVAYRQLQNLLKLSFFVCMVAWTALSGVHALYGGGALFQAADQFLYYGVVLFCANLASLIIQPKAVRKPVC